MTTNTTEIQTEPNAAATISLKRPVAVISAVALFAVGGATGAVAQTQIGDDLTAPAAAQGFPAMPGQAGDAPSGVSDQSGNSARGGQAGSGRPAGSAPTSGEVTSIKGGTIYLKTSDGNTVKVTPASGAEITRTAKSKTSAIQRGDTVIVTGNAGDDGTIAASAVRATAAGLSSGRGGFQGGMPPGGQTSGGGQQPQGGTPPQMQAQ